LHNLSLSPHSTQLTVLMYKIHLSFGYVLTSSCMIRSALQQLQLHSVLQFKHIYTTYIIYICYIHTIYLLHTQYISATYTIYICYIHYIYLLYTLCTYLLYTQYISVIYTIYICYIHNIYRSVFNSTHSNVFLFQLLRRPPTYIHVLLQQ
jgi:hypothetical protein